MTKIHDLKNIPLFQNVDCNLLDSIISNILIKNYNNGYCVREQSQKCNSLDIIVSGSLTSYALSENGNETLLFQFKKNSVIGANLLFAESCIYPCNIYAISDTVLVSIPKESVKVLLHDYNFVMGFIDSLSKNSSGLSEKIAIFTKKSLRQNILNYLQKQSIIQESSTILLPITKKQLANMFCVQRPSLFRELKNMQNDNIIQIKNNHITLL